MAPHLRVPCHAQEEAAVGCGGVTRLDARRANAPLGCISTVQTQLRVHAQQQLLQHGACACAGAGAGAAVGGPTAAAGGTNTNAAAAAAAAAARVIEAGVV
jgi:hypothetical protein